MKKRVKTTALLLSACMLSSLLWPAQTAEASDEGNTVVINEIESDDADGGNDWVEIINLGESDVNISGWFVTDDKGLERLDAGETWGLSEGTVLKAGEVLVLEDSVDFDFGLGREDMVTLYNSAGEQMDTYSWNGHAQGTYSRVPGGSGEFVDQAPTKGAVNVVDPGEGGDEGDTPSVSGNSLVLNEINSSPDDWVELINTGSEAIDAGGFEIRDNSDDHRWKFPEGTTIQPGELYLVKADSLGLIYDDQTDSYAEGTFEAAIGIGSGDSIRLYDAQGGLLDSYSWTDHAQYDGDAAKASWGRYPDGTGAFVLMPETPGTSNSWYAPQVVINEVESNGDDTDWVEICNIGTTAVDLSGWYVLDNDPVGHADETTPVAEGTVLEPGAYYVFDQNKDFDFGLGNEDKATVYAKGGAVVAEYSWSEHADGVWARIPDGTGEFVDFAVSTKGQPNIVTNPVVINEVQSNDPNDGPDWIELANPTGEALDISGIVIKDDDDDHQYVIPKGTSIPAGGFLVITEEEFDFGLGRDDRVRMFEDGRLIAETTWEGHTDPTWGLYPDVNGTEYRSTSEPTPGAANRFADIPEVLPWDGDQEVTVFDTVPTFLEDSSGLDFWNGQLYAVDNGTATFWILDVAKDGSLTFADGFEEGKTVAFQKDAENPQAAGPDSEGITVDEQGMVYLAAERDNSAKGVNYNVILMVDPREEGSRLVAEKEWDLTASLPQVSANMGIEAVEWVSMEEVDGRLWDQNTGEAFAASDYPDAWADGVFFVALEDNGHVYGYVLHEDGTVLQICDMDARLGGAMALDYDTYERVLWVAADDGYANRTAKLSLNGTEQPGVVHMAAPTGVDVTRNNEGFAIASADYTVDGQRPVYRFADGVESGALTIGSLACSYQEHVHSYGEEWYYDGQSHWQQCTQCGEKSEAQSHSYGEYASDHNATCTADGTKTAVCSVCGASDTVADPGSRISHEYVNGKCRFCGAAEPAGSDQGGQSGSDQNGGSQGGGQSGSGQNTDSPQSAGGAQTGEAGDPALWMTMAAIGILGVAAMTVTKKQKEN